VFGGCSGGQQAYSLTSCAAAASCAAVQCRTVQAMHLAGVGTEQQPHPCSNHTGQGPQQLPVLVRAVHAAQSYTTTVKVQQGATKQSHVCRFVHR
jgi:hypothetical protein